MLPAHAIDRNGESKKFLSVMVLFVVEVGSLATRLLSYCPPDAQRSRRPIL